MRRTIRRQEAFTLVEIMVVSVVFSGVVAALFVCFQSARDSQNISSSGVNLQSEARRAFDTMARELREAGNIRSANNVVGNVDFTAQTQVDFQIARGYDVAVCGGTCWGDETSAGRWLHYLVNAGQLVRCSTTNQTDAINFATCRVLANNVQVFQVDYADAALTATVRLDIRQVSTQFRGGSSAVAPNPLVGRIKIRNNS